MKHTLFLLAALVAASAPSVSAQDTDEPKLEFSPTGRLLLDGALYASPDKEAFKDGLAISEIRLGTKAKYGKWDAKIDIGFAYGKIGLKDIYVQYNFDESNFLRAGSFIHHYGLQSTTNASMKISYDQPTAESAFTTARLLGAMYVHSADKYLATISAHVEPQSVILTPNQLGQQGYGVLTRLVAHPVHTGGNVVQFGISGGFASPNTSGDNKGHNVFTFAANFPTQVDKVKALDATMDNAMNLWKFSPELLLSTGPVALEAQYYFNRVNFRNNLHSFTGMGAYAMLRGLLTGGAYRYSVSDACLATPSKGECELVLGYSYTTLNDKKAQYIEDGRVFSGIYGGNANTLSATLNYYINKYMLARLNYTYMHTFNNATVKTDLNIFQVRLQFLF